MVAKLTNEEVKSKCDEAGWILESTFVNIKTKLKVRCKKCTSQREIWWAQIRAKQECTYCTGARIDLAAAFKEKQLLPLSEPKTVRDIVQCKCLICQSINIFAMEKDVNKMKESPCKICKDRKFQAAKQALCFRKGWELYDNFSTRSKRYKAQCIKCGHYSKLHGGTICSSNPNNCKNCRAQLVYKLIGERLDELGGQLSAPINPYDLSKKYKAFCFKCQKDRPLSIIDTVYSGQGFCKQCGDQKRGRARRVKDWKDIFELLGLRYLSGEYINEDSIMQYECLECGKEDATRLSNLRNRRNGGCMYCAGQKIENPLDLFIANDLTPLEDYKDALTPLRCICNRCGEPTSPARNNLQQGHGGCRKCSAKDLGGVYSEGYFENHPDEKDTQAGLYLIDFIDTNGQRFFKIGIHKITTRRVYDHLRLGGKCIQYLAASLYDCWLTEKYILNKTLSKAYVPEMKLCGGNYECFVDCEIWLQSEFLSAVGRWTALFQAKDEAHLIPKSWLIESQSLCA